MRSKTLTAAPFLAAFALAVLFLAAPARAVEVERVVSPGGIEAWLVEDHTNPIISMEFSFKGGASLDPEGKTGTANMLAATLDEGAGPYDSKAFRAKLENLSIKISYDAGLDRFSGSFQTLTQNAEEAYELLRLSLSDPRFDEEPVERIRSQIQIGLAREETDPDAIAGRTLWKLWFPDHPYGRPSDGTTESVAAITRDDLEAYRQTELSLDRLKIGVVGDITPEALGQVLDRVFASLPAEGEPIEVAEAAPQNLGETLVIEQDVPQSVVSLGHAGVKRDDPDYYTAYVVNYILGGGGFASRLFEEVREKRGLAYSVYSYLYPFDHAALVLGGTATANERVSESLGLIREEWARMASEGPTAEELQNAKTYLTGSFPLRFSNSPRIAGMLVGMQQEGLGIDYLEKRNSYIEAVTLEEAKRVAAELYKPEEMTVVVVGKPEGIEATRPAPQTGG
jgi:zinc protease